MKSNLKTYGLIGVLVSSLILNACENKTEAPKSCIEPPCGSVLFEVSNVTLLIQDNLDIDKIGISVDDEVTNLSLNGRDLSNNMPFTCWQPTPLITSSTTVVLGYELNGEMIIGVLNVTEISSNQLVIKIDDDAAVISEFEECIDVM